MKRRCERSPPASRSMRTPADWPVDGLLVHAAGEGAPASASWTCGSPRRRRAGSARSLAPVMQELGVTDLPEVYPAHTFVSA